MAQNEQLTSSTYGFFEWVLILAVVVLAAILAYVLYRSRRLPGEHVFRASRWTRHNRLFPSQLVITESSVTLFKPQWIGKAEESIHMAHVASIKIDTHVLFADIAIETTGGTDPIESHGHTKGDAVKVKNLLEGYQTSYYKSGGPKS